MMRNKIVEEQLKKVYYADMSHFDKETNIFSIPKYSKPKYDLGKMYIVQIDKMLINNKNSILAVNWNNNTAPSTEYLKIYVSKIIGKMIYVDSVGFDINTNADLTNIWSGYISVDDMKQLSTL